MTDIEAAAKRLDDAVARLETAVKSRPAASAKSAKTEADVAAIGQKLDTTIARLKAILGE